MNVLNNEYNSVINLKSVDEYKKLCLEQSKGLNFLKNEHEKIDCGEVILLDKKI